MSDISKRAMLASLSITRWRASITDKKVTKKVATDHNAAEKVGHYRKKLLVEQKLYDAIATVEGEARAFHYANTLPWEDTGARILPATNYMQHAGGMRSLEEKFWTTVDTFIPAYPAMKDAAKAQLNGMWRDEDYPATQDLRGLFNIRVSIRPIPTAGDFRVEINAEDVAQIRAEMDAETRAAMADAMKDAWARIYKAVTHLAEQAGKDKGPFYATNITNLRDLVDVLPRLNLDNDPEMNRICREVEQKLLQHTPARIKADAQVRAYTAQQATALADQMKALLS